MRTEIKIRKTWGNVKPFTRPHSTPKGKRGYCRKENKRIEREGWTMSILMGKFKNQEWEEFDKTNPDSDYAEEEQQTYLLNEYKEISGQGWMFKWVEEEAVEA